MSNKIDLKGSDLKGSWLHQSFLVLPTAAEQDAPVGSPVTAQKWAQGTLTISESEGDRIIGDLVFASGVSLHVTGQITPATDFLPAILQATGKGLQGRTEGAIYELTGWIIASELNQNFIIHGSILAVCGPNTHPDTELGGMPIGTVGKFTLSSL